MKQKNYKYNIKIDGHEISTNDDDVVQIVNYLLGKIDFWKDISDTYKKSINVMWNLNNRSINDVKNKK